jgi:MinD superfamily P-loop ATPase
VKEKYGMKELVVLSGKGGTGKTSIMASFASLAENSTFCDADVDAADLHLLLDPEIMARHDFKGGGEAVIRSARCTGCGLCRELCNWKAVDETFKVDPVACEGCGVCVWFCPEKAIDFPVKTCGQWFISDTRFGPLVHARLGIAEENSGKLVTLVRQEAKKLAENRNRELIITDGPPGIGCPVIASLGGATALLIVTEPTVSGLHDMDRVAQLAVHFKVPAMVCINKCDLNDAMTVQIENYAKKNGLLTLGKIPFDPAFVEAMVQGQTVLEFKPASQAARAVKDIWHKIEAKLG